MTTATTQRPNVIPSPINDPAFEWRNVYFDNRGKVHYGVVFYDSSDAAERRAQEVLRKLRGSPADFTIETTDGSLTIDDYAWHMQVPVIP